VQQDETPTKSPHPHSRQGAEAIIKALAELFPKMFVAAQWEPHRPLAIGIGQELVKLGVAPPGTDDLPCFLVSR
jgi:hypothetical protein